MNKPKAPIVPETTMTPTEQREEWNRSKDMIIQLNKMSRDTKLKVFIGAGVGTEFFTCYMCGGVKPKSMFYTSTDYNVRTGVTRICKACFEELAQRPSNKTTDEVDANREALKYALEYVDQPFYERIYKSAVREASVVNNKTALRTSHIRPTSGQLPLLLTKVCDIETVRPMSLTVIWQN